MMDLGSYRLMVRDKIRMELDGLKCTMGSKSLLHGDLGRKVGPR